MGGQEVDAYLNIDNKKIGESAVDYLSYTFIRVVNALTHFTKNDTGVCVDGEIEVYSGSAMTKESLYGEIRVQIKGTLSKPSGSDSVKYQVNVTDLEKYLMAYDGVLYFVVFMDKSLNLRQIYYKQYLPYDIRATLRRSKAEGQVTITERFYPLSGDPLQLRRLCMEFIADQHRQKGIDEACFLMPGEFEGSEIKFEKIELNKTFYSDELPISLKPFETGAYLYGTASGGKRYVLERIGSLEMIQSASSHTLKAGDYECEAVVNVGEDQDGRFLTVGGISIRLGETGTIQFTDCGGFRDRLRGARLFRGFARSGELFFDGALLGRVGSLNEADFDDLDNRIESYEKFVALMNLLGVVPDWDPSKLSRKDFSQIDRLGEGLMDGRHLSISGHSENMIVFNSDIAGSRVKVLGRLADDGLYEIIDLTSPDLTFAVCRGENGELDTDNPMPTLYSLASDDLCLLANISPTKLEKALERCPVTIGNADTVNNALLEMLVAYDKGAVCEKKLLSCCDITSKALYNLEPNSGIYIINRAQTLLRMRELDEDWKCQLRGIAASSDRKEVRASSFILLGQHELANSCLGSFDELARKRFMTWPIYNLLER